MACGRHSSSIVSRSYWPGCERRYGRTDVASRSQSISRYVSCTSAGISTSLVSLFALSSLFLYAALSQGLLLSVVTNNQQVATQAAAVSSMLPSMLLSGFALPIDNMPWILQKVTNIVPARHYVHAIRGIMLRDVEPSALLGDAVALAAIGTVLLALATARFSRKLA